MSNEYHIAALVVHCRAESKASVCEAIESMEGAEIHTATEEGKLVVTLEQSNRVDLQSGMHALSVLPGVLSASLTYHRVENLDELGETNE
ncbi:chaperone NapD [Ferrimonas balearica]|uniref:chaperone NapD n=1 Tax=Ferrimonas balearica TaxID=44012 RepID=UPI001C9A1D9B|nr:chaperone NapD [Ferrimonas balearica]MBY5922655.1 chaperone NapD [Ferrimonas balearica]MBY5995639.1 chaperone NapD [Ferrimonas balearica]